MWDAREARDARSARRSLCIGSALAGVDGQVTACLEIDDGTVFGKVEKFESSSEESDAEDDADEQIVVRISIGCKCCGANLFGALPVQNFKRRHNQTRDILRKERDCSLMGSPSYGMCSEEFIHQGEVSDAQQTRTTFRYNMFGHSVCRDVFMCAYKNGSTRLKRLQKLVGEKLYYHCAA